MALFLTSALYFPRLYTNKQAMAILDDTVAELIQNAAYLTEENIADLLAAIPGASQPEALSLEVLFQKTRKIVERAYEHGLTSTDPRDRKEAVSMLNGLIDKMIKHAKTIDQQKKAIETENAIVEALTEVAAEKGLPELKERFLAILERNLSGTNDLG